MTTMTRQQEIQSMWRQYQGLYVLAGILIGLLIFPFLELIINDLSQLLIGLVPEAIGIGFTVVILDRVYQNREERRKTDELKERLVRDAGSQVNDVAVKAIEELRDNEWLIENDGLLKNADLREANLSKANLRFANLMGSNLRYAKLLETDLWSAYLLAANLVSVNLKEAILKTASMQNTKLWSAELQGADLWSAKLQNADLSGASLKGANLKNAMLDNVTWESKISGQTYTATLPDGTKWTPDTDMERFINPDHENWKATRQKINAIRKEMRLHSLPD